MTGRVDAVFFDLYGTLLDLRGLDSACEAVAPERGAELAGRWRARQLEGTWLRDAMGRWADFAMVTAEALAVAGRELGLELAAAEVERRLLPAWWSLPSRDGIHPVLDRLDEAGVPSGVLTNGSATMLERSLEHAGLAARFRWRLSVDAVRRYKPSPAVYGLATAAVGSPADRIGFVTGNAWDAAGAAAYGFRVAWLRSAGGELPAVGPLDPPPSPVALDRVAAMFGA